jgi:Kef-type K+ transport system membrane component KefB
MEPDQFDKNRDIRPDSPWQVLQALVTVALIICGLLGIAVHLFGSGMTPYDWWYWLSASVFNSALAVLAVVAVIVFHRYNSHISNQKRRYASNLPVYFMMAVGVYFVYRLLTTGHW